MAKGKSSIQQKLQYQRKQPYTPGQRLELQPCGCDASSRKPAGWVFDLIAERKMTGGFKIRSSNLCPKCRTYRSVNGSCLCD